MSSVLISVITNYDTNHYLNQKQAVTILFRHQQGNDISQQLA
jgi:hypothetical protein